MKNNISMIDFYRIPIAHTLEITFLYSYFQALLKWNMKSPITGLSNGAQQALTHADLLLIEPWSSEFETQCKILSFRKMQFSQLRAEST